MSEISFKKFLPDEAATLELAGNLAQLVGDAAIIFLHGSLGAGKTTFSRGFLRGLGFTGKVKSPTYTLVEPYQLENCSLYHFDLYRIHDANELEFMGIREYFVPHAICLIEWPEHGGSLLPKPDLNCYIEISEHGREINLIANSERGLVWIGKIKS